MRAGFSCAISGEGALHHDEWEKPSELVAQSELHVSGVINGEPTGTKCSALHARVRS
jgi:hypothetical protein